MGLFDGTILERPVLCERCDQDIKLCQCPPMAEVVLPRDPSKQRLRVRVEKRKRGKWMTVVAGFEGPPTQLQDVLTRLKNHCGAGGTIAGGNVEIQGDQAERVRAKLLDMGYRVGN